MNRVILLVDMNAFFISCETSRDQSLVGIPAAVAGDPGKRTGIILAANYEARARNLKTAMTVAQAIRLCPELRLVKPDHDFYKQKSKHLMQLLNEFSPIVEPNSIDEAWIDLSGCEKIYSTPMQAAELIMTDINKRLGIPCSIGISSNKFLAKMAAEMRKPQGITELWPEQIASLLWPLPVNNMYGIGSKTANKLTAIGIKTIGDLAAVKPKLLSDMFGRSGLQLYNHANGIDPETVTMPSENEVKSIGKSVTLAKDANSPDEVRTILIKLADEIARSARKHKKQGSVIRITIKYSDFSITTRQCKINPTASGNDIYQHAYQLMTCHWKTNSSVRLVGITLANFSEEIINRQLTLFDFDKCQLHGMHSDKHKLIQTNSLHGADDRRRLEETIDAIKQKHGKSIITRGSLLENKECSKN